MIIPEGDNSCPVFNKALQKGSCRSAVAGGPWGQLVRSCLERLSKIHSVSENNEIHRRRMAVQGMGVPTTSWEGKGMVLHCLYGHFLQWDKAYVWSCCPSLFLFQPQSWSLINLETQFIKKRQLGMIIFLYLPILCLLGQNDSTQTHSHNQQS